MPAVQGPTDQRIVLESIRWEQYTGLLRLLQKHHLRLTYDRGTLEIRTLSQERERLAEFLARLAVILTEELNLHLKAGGSTTFRRRRVRRGLEPDRCFWIASEPLVRGKREIDLRNDPPPDLAIEIDVSRSSLDRLAIYAKLGVPEVWRLEGGLAFHVLGADRKYAVAATSRSFPQVTAKDLSAFLAMIAKQDENQVAGQFRAWVRQNIAGGSPPSP